MKVQSILLQQEERTGKGEWREESVGRKLLHKGGYPYPLKEGTFDQGIRLKSF